MLEEARDRNQKRLFVEASHVARPFFEHRGFSVLEENEITRNGVILVNYSMEMRLGPDNRVQPDMATPGRRHQRLGEFELTDRTSETSAMIYARTAGFLYLIIIICGVSSEVFIRSGLVVTGDATGTAKNILASEGLFRLGFFADSLMLLSDVAIAVIFYVLLKPVSKTLALMAAAFRLTQAAILGINLLNYYAALLLLQGIVYTAAFDREQLNSLAMLFLDMHSHGYDLGLLFFGFSSLILGYLVIKSDYFPGIFGYGLIAAAVVYLTGSFTRFLFPDFISFIEPIYIVPLIAEVAFCLWLVIRGVRARP